MAVAGITRRGLRNVLEGRCFVKALTEFQGRTSVGLRYQSNGGLCFDLPDEVLEFQNIARKFAREEILPVAAELDRTMEYPWDLIKKAWKLGILNHGVPEKYGGAGLKLIPQIAILEELGYACTGVSTVLSNPGLAHCPLILGASDAQKKKYLGRCIEEPIVAAYAATESTGGSDVAAIKTKAVKKGKEYILNGSKMWITGAGPANWMFVLARTHDDPNAPSASSMSGFIIESEWGGVVVGRKEEMMGQRCSDTRGITFEDVRIPEENRIMGEGDGFKLAMAVFNATRPATAIAAVGLAQRALDEATKYALERQTFGTAIASHQAVAFMLADMAAEVETARLMAYKAAWEIDQGKPNPYLASIAKLHASNAANNNATNAVQIFGGAGYCNDYPVEKLMRDAKIFQIYEGTSQIQKLIISRDILKRAKMG